MTTKLHANIPLLGVTVSEDGGQALTVEQWSCPWDGRRGQIPLMIIHGTADSLVPYEPTVRTARWWATSMGYTQVEYPGYPCGDFSCTSTVWTAGGASPDATDPPTPLVAHIAVHGGDHAWDLNGIMTNLGAQTCTSGCFGTADLALDFLFRYRSPPAPPSPPTLTGCRWDAPWIEECAAGCCSDTGESAICGGGHGMYTNPPCWECLDQTDGICAPCWEHCLPSCADCYIKQPPSAPAPPMPPPPLGCRWENEECAAGCCASTGDAALCGGKHPSFDNPPCWECQYLTGTAPAHRVGSTAVCPTVLSSATPGSRRPRRHRHRRPIRLAAGLTTTNAPLGVARTPGMPLSAVAATPRSRTHLAGSARTRGMAPAHRVGSTAVSPTVPSIATTSSLSLWHHHGPPRVDGGQWPRWTTPLDTPRTLVGLAEGEVASREARVVRVQRARGVSAVGAEG